MSFTKNIIIECSRENAENVKITQRSTGSQNASWTNKVNFNFQVGDQVNLESAVIHSIGASADSTIEITGENDDINGYADNFLGMKFNNYIGDNGYNTIHLPFHSPNTTLQNFGLNPISADANNINGYDFPGQSMPIIQEVTGDNCEVNHGMPQYKNNSFRFRYKLFTYTDGGGNKVERADIVEGFFGNNPKYVRTLFGLYRYENSPNCQLSISGRKYTKLRGNYCGPYRRNTESSEELAQFWDFGDVTALTSSLAIKFDAPIYESPSTICNKINTELHATLPMGEAPQFGIVPKKSDNKLIPHVSGNLMKVIGANGLNTGYDGNTTDTDRVAVNRCWGNIAVESLEKWKSIHEMMHCELAFSMKGKFRSSPTEYRFPRPCIFMDGLAMKQNYRITYNGNLTPQANKGFMPRVLKQFSWKAEQKSNGVDLGTKTVSIPYAVLPKYFVISTNIKYTSKNVRRIKEWFKNMERYVGVETELAKCNLDTENWEVVADLGSSRDGMNLVDEPQAFDLATNAEEKYGTGGAVPNVDKYYAPYTGISRRLRNGAFDVQVDDSNDISRSSVYAFSEPLDPYGLSNKNGDSNNVGEVKGVCSPRSDIPGTEYIIAKLGDVSSGASQNEQYEIKTIETDVPCRFMDNEYKNCGMVLFSKQIDFNNWRFSNLGEQQSFAQNNQEGYGEWIQNGDIKSSDIDTSLDSEIGVYGMNIANNDSPANDKEKCCVFILAHDSATYDSTNEEWVPNNPYALPNIYHGLFFGLSPSFMDSPAIWCINQERIDGNANDAVDESDIQNFMNIGANDATCEFDSALSRAKFFNFHTQRVLGAREMPLAAGVISKETLGNFVIKIDDKTYYYQDAFNWSETVDAADPTQNTVTLRTGRGSNGISTSICGLNLIAIYTNVSTGKATSIDDMVEITEESEFYNSLLYKLGFDYKQLFPDFGLESNWYDPSIELDYTIENRYRQTKPISTNAKLDISQVLALAIQDSTTVPIYNTAAKEVQTYQLGFNSGESTALDGTTSQSIVANNLPIKMDNSFYRIHSNIIPTIYKTENENINIIGVCPKNYVEGDFIYSPDPSSYTTTAEFPLKIGEITTEIRLPNGRLAPIDQKSSVTYKIQRTMVLPNMEEIVQDIKKGQKK